MADQLWTPGADEGSGQAEPKRASAPVSRRTMLRRSAAVAAVAAPMGLLAACGGTAATKAVTSKGGPTILAARRASVETPRTSYPAAPFQEIMQDEDAHVQFLQGALGSAARPKPTFKGLDASNISTFVTLSRTFENVGVGAYLFGASAISDKNTLLKAATILTVEARHAGFLDEVTGQALSPNGAFDKPLSQSDIVNAVSPFIASLNGGPDPSGALKSDTDILNFALLLEFLEATFYDMNVPKFFGGSVPGNG